MEASYIPLKELKGVNSQPINAMLFSDNAKYLVVAGDDEKVRIWNVETFHCEQTLEDSRWGQVTSLAWLYQELPNHDTMTALCVGNARGSLSIYTMDLRGVKPFPKPATPFTPFEFNDSVEQQAFDKLNRRLAVGSHSGELRMYRVDIASTASLTVVWEGHVGDVVLIPSSLFFFGGANQSLLATCLENSEVSCRDAENSNILWQKALTGGIGYASLSSDETLLLVNNLTTGNFDLYNVSDKTLLRSLPISSQRRFVKQCKFFEGSKFAICGSDTNKALVVDITTNCVVQSLVAGKVPGMVQTVAATPASSRRVIVAGACGGSVHLWEKPSAFPSSMRGRLRERFFSYNIHVCLLVIVLTFGAWYPYFSKFVDLVKANLASSSVSTPITTTPLQFQNLAPVGEASVIYLPS